MQLDIKIIDPRIQEEENYPKYQTKGSAGIDLRACISKSVWIQSNETVLIGAGFAIGINNPEYAAMLLPRSGLGHKNGIVLGNLVGLIDSDYQGMLQVSLWNRSEIAYEVKPMDRIAQLVIVPVKQVQFNQVESFEESERGEGGFGSTGNNLQDTKQMSFNFGGE